MRYFKSAAGCCVECLSIGCARFQLNMSKVFGYPALQCQYGVIVTWDGPCVTCLEVRTGGTHSKATAAAGSARVGRQICQSVASGVCFQTQPRLHAFVFNFIYLSFLESHTWQPQELIARQMRGGNNAKGGCRTSGFVRFRCTVGKFHFLTREHSLFTNEY